MGYSDVDTLAVNTIRLLAVSLYHLPSPSPIRTSHFKRVVFSF